MLPFVAHCLTAELRNVKRFDMLLRAFAEENGCTFIEMQSRKQFQDPSIYVEDNVHYNQKGYDLYAEVFRKELASELAKY